MFTMMLLLKIIIVKKKEQVRKNLKAHKEFI